MTEHSETNAGREEQTAPTWNPHRREADDVLIAHNAQVMPPEDAPADEVPNSWNYFEDFLRDQTDREDMLGEWARAITEDVEKGCWPHSTDIAMYDPEDKKRLEAWQRHLIYPHDRGVPYINALKRLHAEYIKAKSAAWRRCSRERSTRAFLPNL